MGYMFVTHTTSILFCKSNCGSSLKVTTLSISIPDLKTKDPLFKLPVALNVCGSSAICKEVSSIDTDLGIEM
jgi:hypothetical protein